MIFYLLFLVLALVYFIRIIYRNYRKGRSFQDGQNRIVSNIILLCIVIGQFLIPYNLEEAALAEEEASAESTVE